MTKEDFLMEDKLKQGEALFAEGKIVMGKSKGTGLNMSLLNVEPLISRSKIIFIFEPRRH